MLKAFDYRLRKIKSSLVDATEKLCELPMSELERRLRSMSNGEFDHHLAILQAQLGCTDAP
jgi:hypothetical protein